MGSWGNTSSTSKAAFSAIRRAPQLGQIVKLSNNSCSGEISLSQMHRHVRK
jgi:hypothetical protein